MKLPARLFTAVFALVTLVTPTDVFAQDYRATIVGLINDSNKAAIPDAKVKVTNERTNVVTETVTNSDGFYTIPFLNPDRYAVEVTASGFKTVKQTGVVLQVSDKLNLPFTLETGQIEATVIVTATQEILHTESASRGQNFDEIKTQELPLNGRQVYMLMALTTGVLFTQEQFGSSGFSGTRGWDTNGSYIINGGRSGTNQFLLNGAPISLTGSWQVAPNVEAIQEFKVMTNTYDAQFGRTGGGTVNTTLKAGTSQWHGTVFEYARNSLFDANTIQNKAQGKDRGIRNTHQFGGTAGGTLRKDRDFIFASFEGFREVVPFPVVAGAPVVDLRDGKNFTKYGIKVYDPLTTHLCVPGKDTPAGQACQATYIRDQFPNNEIPANRISPIGRAILNLWPSPNTINATDLTTGQQQRNLSSNFLAANSRGRYRYDQPMGRWDHVFSENDRMHVIATFQHGNEFRNQNGFEPPAQAGNVVSERTDQNYIADWTHVWSPRTVMDTRLSYGRFTSYFPDGLNSFDFTYDKLGIKNMPNIPTVGGRKTAPRFNLTDASAIIGNSFSWSSENQWDFTSSVTHTRGRHNLHIGGEWAYGIRANDGPGRANGEFSFTRDFTGLYSGRNSGVSDGSGIASLLLGIPNSGFVDWNGSFYRSFQYLAGYIQDDWKVNTKLTLNLGLRYDVQLPIRERFNRANGGFDFTVKNPDSDKIIAKWKELKAAYDATNPKYPYPDAPSAIYGGKTFLGKDEKSGYNIDWSNIQPRIGFAWNALPKTVLRGGFAIYHRTITNTNTVDGFSQQTPYITSLDGGITPSAGLTGPYSLENPFPNGAVQPLGAAGGILTNIGRGVSYDGRQLIVPRTYSYSFAIERELPWNMVAEVSYVGSQTVKDTFSYQRDNVSYADFLKGQGDNFYLDRTLPNPFFGFLPTVGQGASNTTNGFQLLRPYTLFQGITQNILPWAKYRYDALQVRGEKRVLGSRQSGILTFILSYTFSKNFEANHRLNDWNLNEPAIHELSNLDKPHQLAFSGVWDLPIGKNRWLLNDRHKFVGALVDNWTFDWIYTYSSGYPVNKPDAIFNYAACGDYRIDNPTPDKWFATTYTDAAGATKSCYTSRARYTLRVAEDRFGGGIRNYAKPQLNLAIAKTFRVRERFGVLFRAETFNAFNTPILPPPTTDFNSANLGRLVGAQFNFPRLVQFAAKITF